MSPAVATGTDYDTDVVGSRVVAQAVDLVVAGVPFLAIVLAIRSATDVELRVAFAAASPLLIGYGAVLEGVWNGQTVGKWLVRVEVRSEDGSAIGPAQAILRNLPAALAPGLAIYLVSLLSVATTERRQRVFDQVAGTVVVQSY